MGTIEEARDRTVRMVVRASGDEDEIRHALEGFEAAIRNDIARKTYDGMTQRFCTKTPACRFADGHKGVCDR
jgi:hypothetical protein